MILINKITFYYACDECYIVICVNGDTVSLEFIISFLIVLLRLYTTEEIYQFFNLLGKGFFTLFKWRIELNFMQSNPLLWKNTIITKGVCFFCSFLVFSQYHHMFLTHQLYLMQTFLNLFLSFLLRLYQNCHSYFLEEMLLCELINLIYVKFDWFVDASFF